MMSELQKKDVASQKIPLGWIHAYFKHNRDGISGSNKKKN